MQFFPTICSDTLRVSRWKGVLKFFYRNKAKLFRFTTLKKFQHPLYMVTKTNIVLFIIISPLACVGIRDGSEMLHDHDARHGHCGTRVSEHAGVARTFSFVYTLPVYVRV